MDAIQGRISGNRIVQFTDAYPETGMCNSETLILKKEHTIHERLSCEKADLRANVTHVPYASALKSEPTNIQIVTQHIPS